jgi:hypothetical protein
MITQIKIDFFNYCYVLNKYCPTMSHPVRNVNNTCFTMIPYPEQFSSCKQCGMNFVFSEEMESHAKTCIDYPNSWSNFFVNKGNVYPKLHNDEIKVPSPLLLNAFMKNTFAQLTPIAPVALPKPVAPVALPKPVAPVALPKPVAPVALPKPVAPVALPKPVAPVALPKPVAKQFKPLVVVKKFDVTIETCVPMKKINKSHMWKTLLKVAVEELKHV